MATIVCKMEDHPKSRMFRGYIAMLVVIKPFRGMGIGELPTTDPKHMFINCAQLQSRFGPGRLKTSKVLQDVYLSQASRTKSQGTILGVLKKGRCLDHSQHSLTNSDLLPEHSLTFAIKAKADVIELHYYGSFKGFAILCVGKTRVYFRHSCKSDPRSGRIT